MGLRRWNRGSVMEALFYRDVVPAKDLVRVKVVDNGEGVQLVQAGHNTTVFNFRQPADVQDELRTSPARRQLEARAFHLSIRQSESFAGLPQTKARVHVFLRRDDCQSSDYNSITILLRIRNKPFRLGRIFLFPSQLFLGNT